MNTIIVLLLGCHIKYIQNDRIDSAINFIDSNYKKSNIIWFLTGGIKYDIPKIIQQPESIEMINYINLMNSKLYSKWEYILDSDATNTAENFGNFRSWFENTNINKNNKVYIVTSEFHLKRAKKILNGIISDNNFEWIISKKECNYCNHNEVIHSQNIENDIKMGLKKYNQLK